MITQEMVSKGVDAVVTKSPEFDSHAVIEWLINNCGEDYLADLQRRGGKAAPPRSCQIGSADIRREITARATAAKALDNQICKMVKKCSGVVEIDDKHMSPTLWGIPGPNYLWRKETKLNNAEKIQVILHEYDSLRAEIISQQSHFLQLLAVGSILFLWFLKQTLDLKFWIALTFSVLVLAAFAVVFNFEVIKKSKRLAEIEKSVNIWSGNEEILVWESKWGGVATGMWFPRMPKKPQ
jgi:hypothetical protein